VKRTFRSSPQHPFAVEASPPQFAASIRAAGSGRASHVCPPSRVSRKARHSSERAQGTSPGAQPVISETKVTDPGLKSVPVGAAIAANALDPPFARMLRVAAPAHRRYRFGAGDDWSFVPGLGPDRRALPVPRHLRPA
jgi:hypothetical protein